jgi:hypothetical protein
MLKPFLKNGLLSLGLNRENAAFLIEWLHKTRRLGGEDEIRIEAMEPTPVLK